MPHGPLDDILILLASAVVAVALFRRLALPPILGYLLVGLLVGPHALGLVADTEGTRFIAEFGVVFLLFMLGLEFSLPQLVSMRGAVLGVGGFQVAVTTALVAGGAWLIGLDASAAIVVGGILALSSTAIVTKQLTEQLEINSRHGRMSVGILLFQDLAVVPFLVLIPILGGEAEAMATALGWAALKAVVVFAAMLAIGHWLLRPLFQEVARARSPELFTMAVLLVALTAAWATHSAGLSLALGAFLAGMMLSETEYRHQVETDIRPFRDLLLGLFFITVGMLLNPASVLELGHWMALLALALLVGKSLIVLGIGALAGVPGGVALRTGLTVAQGGEFGFALLALALQQEPALLGETTGQVVLGGIFLSMALSPLVIRYNGSLAKWLFSASYGDNRARMTEAVAATGRELEDHVIICGYGRVGQNIARLLEQEGFSYMALDLDPLKVREAHSGGEEVHYGDATRREILDAAGLERARLVVISYNDAASALRILEHVRQADAEKPVLVRTTDDSCLEELLRSGATEVIPETLEASLVIGTHLLFLMGVPAQRVAELEQRVRGDRYRLLRGFFRGQEPAEPGSSAAQERLHSVPLEAGARAVGRNLGELDLESLGVQVTAVRRGGIRGPQPGPETTLRDSDVLVLYGTPQALERAEMRLLRG
jgi:CPA2 family monovalent cation:H+ antiporter-2